LEKGLAMGWSINQDVGAGSGAPKAVSF
jgi:hypothetical protein